METSSPSCVDGGSEAFSPSQPSLTAGSTARSPRWPSLFGSSSWAASTCSRWLGAYPVPPAAFRCVLPNFSLEALSNPGTSAHSLSPPDGQPISTASPSDASQTLPCKLPPDCPHRWMWRAPSSRCCAAWMRPPGPSCGRWRQRCAYASQAGWSGTWQAWLHFALRVQLVPMQPPNLATAFSRRRQRHSRLTRAD